MIDFLRSPLSGPLPRPGARKPGSAATGGRKRYGVHAGGFTLIELLVAVAIIAVLAAIALPNFLEAQIRSKAARAKSDMRTLSIGLEAYQVDYGGYVENTAPLTVLTTPVAYIPVLPADIFFRPESAATFPFPGADFFASLYGYGSMPVEAPSRYALTSLGPDTDLDAYLDGDPESLALRLYPGFSEDLFSGLGADVNSVNFRYVAYDPTNGTLSSGDIHRLSDLQGH